MKRVLVLLVIVSLLSGSLFAATDLSAEKTPRTVAQPVLAKHAKRIGAVLPKGWSISTKGSMVTVLRDKEVRGEPIRIINIPRSDKPNSVAWIFHTSLRFSP